MISRFVIPTEAVEPNVSNGGIYTSVDNGNGTNGNDTNGNNGNNGNNLNGDNGNNGNGEKALEELENRIRGLEAQLLAMWSLLSAQPETDYASINRQSIAAAELERYMFHMKYYGVCLAIARNDLLNRQRSLTERQLVVERVRLDLGFSTLNNVNALDATLNSLRRQIELNDETAQITRQHINTRRGETGYTFIRNFELPVPSSPNVRSADELRAGLINNNASLFVLNSQIDQLSNQNVSWAELRLLHEQRDLLIRQLEMAAINSWTSYLNARAQYDIAIAVRPMLTTRLNLVDEMYRLGEISTVDMMGQRFSVYEELHREDMAAVALAIAVAELDYMMRGIAA